MGEMCVTWHFLLGWVDDMNRSLDPYSVLLTSKWPLLPFDSGMLLYHNEWDRRLTLFVEKRHNVWKTFMMIPLLLLYFNWIYKNAILRGCRWSIVELVLEESESLKKKRKKKNLIMKCFKNTLFEIFIFCPRIQLWFPEKNCRIGEKLVKILRF